MHTHSKTTLSTPSVNILKQMLQYDHQLRSGVDVCLQSDYFDDVEIPP
jgi:hypothetical protein